MTILELCVLLLGFGSITIGYLILRRNQLRYEAPAEDQTPSSPPSRYQTIYAYTKSGELLFQSTQYSPDYAFFSDQQAEYLQNHPGCVAIRDRLLDLPPTLSDLAYASYLRLDHFVVVSPHYTYAVRPGRFGWRNNVFLKQVIRCHLSKLHLTFEGDPEIDISEDGEVSFFGVIRVQPTDAAIEAITRDLGYAYEKRPLDSDATIVTDTSGISGVSDNPNTSNTSSS